MTYLSNCQVFLVSPALVVLLVVCCFSTVTAEAGCPNGRLKVIVDSDISMHSYAGLDIDDDLAVAFLFASPCVDVLGVTVTHGNAMISTTCPLGKQLVKALHAEDESAAPPVKCGRGFFSYFTSTTTENEASTFIAEMARKHPKEIVLLSLGAVTNVAGAIYHYPETMKLLKEVVIMGGNYYGFELNFAMDKGAADFLLAAKVPKTLITAQICLNATFDVNDANKLLDKKCGSFAQIAHPIMHKHAQNLAKLNPWLFVEDADEGKEKKGFHPWDIVAAAYITNKELFQEDKAKCVDIRTHWYYMEEDEVPCDQPGVTNVQTSFDSDRFIDLMVSRLCSIKTYALEDSEKEL